MTIDNIDELKTVLRARRVAYSERAAAASGKTGYTAAIELAVARRLVAEVTNLLALCGGEPEGEPMTDEKDEPGIEVPEKHETLEDAYKHRKGQPFGTLEEAYTDAKKGEVILDPTGERATELPVEGATCSGDYGYCPVHGTH